MAKKFITKKRKYKFISIIILFIIGIIISYKRLNKSKIRLNDKSFTDLITSDTFTYNDTGLFNKTIIKIINLANPVMDINTKYNKSISSNKLDIKKGDPLIYMYNSHQTEEYASSNIAEYSVTPTVIMNNYILEDIFNKNGYNSVVEEASIKDILNKNNWKYYNSYKASRILLEKSIVTYPTLKYFIDIHRDSLPRNRTIININNKDYARVLFIVGLENNNWKENLDFTTKINDKLNLYYPNLSKGILKKQGRGVNGVYNQDFNNRTILVEIGGYENTSTEVLNSAIAFGKCFMEVIKDEGN